MHICEQYYMEKKFIDLDRHKMLLLVIHYIAGQCLHLHYVDSE